MVNQEMDELRLKYAELAKVAKSAEDFYRQVRKDGVSTFKAHVLLRDLLGKNLQECMDITAAVEGGT
jgi:hypothetical protein